LYTNGWNCYNHINYAKANTQFKIITCDPRDDTVDLFSSLQTGVAERLAQIDYNLEEWRRFYDSLIYVCDYEDRLFKSLDFD